jgi:hypothetical protein
MVEQVSAVLCESMHEADPDVSMGVDNIIRGLVIPPHLKESALVLARLGQEAATKAEEAVVELIDVGERQRQDDASATEPSAESDLWRDCLANIVTALSRAFSAVISGTIGTGAAAMTSSALLGVAPPPPSDDHAIAEAREEEEEEYNDSLKARKENSSSPQRCYRGGPRTSQQTGTAQRSRRATTPSVAHRGRWGRTQVA